VADIDKQIDELYRLPLAEFTAARTALAKTLSGDTTRHVRALKKPTAVPAAVNQLYWKARPTYDAAMKAGHALRAAQIATLNGKKADVRAATEAHRKAIASAVHRAVELASEAGLNPNTDQLARMFEALSLAAAPASAPGRFADVIAPSGFDALAGVTPVTRVHTTAHSDHAIETEHATRAPKIDRAAEKRRLEQERREQREAEARLRTATRDLERARERAQEARDALKRAEGDVAAAERAVADARERVRAN
jgi:uncharacterized protein YecT (DUF1311 family)